MPKLKQATVDELITGAVIGDYDFRLGKRRFDAAHRERLKSAVRSGDVSPNASYSKTKNHIRPGLLQLAIYGTARYADETDSYFPDLVQLLLEMGADVTQCDGNRVHVIHDAAQSRDFDLLKQLVALGADPKVRTADGRNALHSFFQPFKFEISSDRDNAIVQWLLDQGVECQTVESTNGLNAFHAAVLSSCGHVIPVLATASSARAAIKAASALAGMTPLHLASCAMNNTDFSGTMNDARMGIMTDSEALLSVKNLIEAGCDVHALDWKGRSCAHLAAIYGSPELLEVLSDHGVDLNARAIDGRTPLHMAIASDRPPSTFLDLLRLGANPEASDLDGVTAIAFAKRRRSPNAAAFGAIASSFRAKHEMLRAVNSVPNAMA